MLPSREIYLTSQLKLIFRTKQNKRAHMNASLKQSHKQSYVG